MLKIFLVGLVMVGVVHGAITCYEVDGPGNADGDNAEVFNTESNTCATGEACYKERFTDQDGYLYFNRGCAAECKEIKMLDAYNDLYEVFCCATEKCNSTVRYTQVSASTTILAAIIAFTCRR